MKRILIVLVLIALPLGSYYLVHRYLSEHEDDHSHIQKNDKGQLEVKMIEKIQNEIYNLADNASK